MKSYKVFFLSIMLLIALLPINYLVGSKINVLPLQFPLGVMIYLWCFKIGLGSQKSKIVLFAFIINFLILSVYNINDPVVLASSPIILTLFNIALLGVTNLNLNGVVIMKVNKPILLFFILFSVISVYFNVQHIQEHSLTIRSKGFGSGTLYSILSLLMILFLYDCYKYRLISRNYYLINLIVPVWSLLLTQSRGVIVTLLIIIIWKNLSSKRKAIVPMLIWTPVIIISFFIIPSIWESDLIKRFDPTSFDSIEEFTSNRLYSQLFLINELFNTDLVNLILGNGLNDLKNLLKNTYLVLPHFDPLYVLHDAGVITLCFYMFFILMALKNCQYSKYLFVYIISTFHTNMIISPTFIVLVALLILNLKQLKIKFPEKSLRNKDL